MLKVAHSRIHIIRGAFTSTYDCVANLKFTRTMPNGYRSTWCILATAAAIISQLTAAPTPAPVDEYIQSGQSTMNSMAAQGQQYGNYAMNQAQSSGQYAADQMRSSGQYAADQMRANGQYAADQMANAGSNLANAGTNLANRAQNSIGNISLNPLSYVPSWMTPSAQDLSNLAQTTSNYANYYAQKGNEMLHRAGEEGKEMLRSAQETGSYYLQRGIENGQYLMGRAREKGQEIASDINSMAQAAVGRGRNLASSGIQQGANSVQTMGGYERSYLGSFGEQLDSMNGYIAERLYKTADGVGNLSIPNLDQQLNSY